MENDQIVVFIHGLGDSPAAWEHQVESLPTGFRGVPVEVPGLGRDGSPIDGFTLAEAAAGIVGELDSRGIESAHLCGLSLGAMIAFRIAVDHPERVSTLILAAGQVKPPRALMAVQSAIMRALPARVVSSGGVSKAQLLAVVDAIAATDLSGELASVAVPTLVLCGSRDRANLPAARAFAHGIPDAEFRTITGAGHRSNTQAPERFSAILNEFLLRCAAPRDAARAAQAGTVTGMPLLNTPLPIVAAPMAGGPTTPGLVTAVARAGGFGFLAGGYQTTEGLAAQIAEVRRGTQHFGVNLFVPSSTGTDREAFRRYALAVQPEADAHGVSLSPVPVDDDDQWDRKLRLLIEQPVPVVSLTFALPDPAAIVSLQRVGTDVLATVTTSGEALEAQAAGVDGLIVQGSSAGGHSATFDPARQLRDTPTAGLVREICSTVSLPVIAAGGVDGPAAVGELLDAGAEAVAVGTLLMCTDEAGTSATHRAALSDPALTETVITRAFTGRPARALRNGFIERHDHHAPTAYPAVHHLTRELRRAASRAGDADRLHLWAGTGYRAARPGPAGDVVRHLA